MEICRVFQGLLVVQRDGWDVRGRGVLQSYKGVAWKEGALAYRPLGLEEAKVCALGGGRGIASVYYRILQCPIVINIHGIHIHTTTTGTPEVHTQTAH